MNAAYAGRYAEVSTNKMPPVSQTKAHVTSVAHGQSCIVWVFIA